MLLWFGQIENSWQGILNNKLLSFHKVGFPKRTSDAVINVSYITTKVFEHPLPEMPFSFRLKDGSYTFLRLLRSIPKLCFHSDFSNHKIACRYRLRFILEKPAVVKRYGHGNMIEDFGCRGDLYTGEGHVFNIRVAAHVALRSSEKNVRAYEVKCAAKPVSHKENGCKSFVRRGVMFPSNIYFWSFWLQGASNEVKGVEKYWPT